MKKLFTFALVALFAINFAAAQDVVVEESDNSNAVSNDFGPKQGDYAVGVNAVPFLNYVGNVFNGTAGNSVSWAFPNNGNALMNNTLYAKYMLTDNTAARIRFNLGMNMTTNKAATPQDGDPTKTVDDVQKLSTTAIAVAAGLEMRRGEGRIVGFYGAEAFLGLGSNKETYVYGNPYSTTATSPGTNNFGTNVGGGARVLSNKTGMQLSLGARAFAGAEFFVMKNLSIGGEFGYGLGLTFGGATSGEAESWDGVNNRTLITTFDSPAGSVFNLGTDNLGGAIFMYFYF